MPRDNEGSTYYVTCHSEDLVFYFKRGTAEGTRLLLERSTGIDAENNKGETPLQVALKARHYETVVFLSDFGAKELRASIPRWCRLYIYHGCRCAVKYTTTEMRTEPQNNVSFSMPSTLNLNHDLREVR